MSRIIPNSFQVPNYFADEVMQHLNGAELKVLLYAIRRIYGFQRNSDRIPLSQFLSGKIIAGKAMDSGTGLSKGPALKAVKTLLEAKILVKLSENPATNTGCEYTINQDDTEIDLSVFTKRQEAGEEALRGKLEKANRARQEKLQAVHRMNRPENETSGSSDEPKAGSSDEPKAGSSDEPKAGSSDEPLIINKKTSRKPEGKPGEKAPGGLPQAVPPNKEEPSLCGFERTVSDAITELFPAEEGNQNLMLQLVSLALKFNVKTSDVDRWPSWLAAKHPRKSPNYHEFKATLPHMMREGQPGTWLNGSIGSRFTLLAFGLSVETTIDAGTQNRVLTVGHWLDEQLANLSDKEVWKQKGYTPTSFLEFWRERFPESGKPSPESIQRYWDDFEKWLRRGQGI